MKRLKNYDKTICGIDRGLYSIILNTGLKPKTRRLYFYYIYSFFRKRMVRIEMSCKKLTWYNKYTLPVVCVAFNFIELLIFIFHYPILYFSGLHDFFADIIIGRGMELFHNVNFFAFISLLIWFIFNAILS